MDDQARAGYENQSLQLRAELKKWENEWASAHGGNKPGRNDIKQNPDIAQKYKQYNKLRDILAGKFPPPGDDRNQQPRKRRQSDANLPPQTPSKRSKPAQTPRKAAYQHPDESRTPAATPSLNRTVLTPAKPPTSISPTPHKDGRVLGLFDLLAGTPPSKSLTAATPSRARRTVDVSGLLTTTPTTRAGRSSRDGGREEQQEHGGGLFYTASATATPRHNRPLQDGGNAVAITTTTPKSCSTPSQIAKQQLIFSTPAFLRRRHVNVNPPKAPTFIRTLPRTRTLSRVDEVPESEPDIPVEDNHTRGGEGEGKEDDEEDEEEAWKTIGPLRLPRRLGPAKGKGLSSIVAGLRRLEEEAHAEEEEVMREMELGGDLVSGGGNGNGGNAGNGPQGREEEEKEAKSRQPPVLLSAFDDEGVYDSGPEDVDRQQQPTRVFKKRGQKRTTRRANLRPTRVKRPTSQTGADDDDDEDEDDAVIPETQLVNTAASATAVDGDDELRLSEPDTGDGSDSDEEFVVDALDDGKNKNKKKTAARQKKQSASNKDKDKDKPEAADGVVKRAVRKVKATAHANFKRLKLRNSGAKGGQAHNSRWRRRR